MPTYAFETIPSEQALQLSTGDILTVSSPAREAVLWFQPGGQYMVTIAGRSLTFNASFPSFANSGRLQFADQGQLYVGSEFADVRNFGSIPTPGGAAYGGEGNDIIMTSPGGSWFVQGNQGADQLQARSGWSNTIFGGQGNDSIVFDSSATPQRQFVHGNLGNDVIQGAGGDDTLLGGQGIDRIYGVGGRDFINGNLGDDFLYDGFTMFGEGGNDLINVMPNGFASGGDGNDEIVIISVSGGPPSATVAHGDAGHDILRGHTRARDEIYGDDGDDFIRITHDPSSTGSLLGSRLDGGAGDDTILANLGDDMLIGGTGVDELTGGGGADRFELTSATGPIDAAHADRILDWGADDRLAFGAAGLSYAEATAADFASAVTAAQGLIGAGGSGVVAVQVGADVIVFADTGPAASIDIAAVLVGRSLADVGAANVA